MSWADTLPLGHLDDPTRARIFELAEPITAMTGVSLKAMLGTNRTARIARARHLLFAALWRSDFSISEIGRLLGRDHTGVMHGIRRAMGPEEYKAAQLDRALRRTRVA